MEEKLSRSEATVDIPELEEQEAKEILHDVLNELYYSKGKIGNGISVLMFYCSIQCFCPKIAAAKSDKLNLGCLIKIEV